MFGWVMFGKFGKSFVIRHAKIIQITPMAENQAVR